MLTQPEALAAAQGLEGPLQLPVAVARSLPELPGNPPPWVAAAAMAAHHLATQRLPPNNALARPGK